MKKFPRATPTERTIAAYEQLLAADNPIATRALRFISDYSTKIDLKVFDSPLQQLTLIEAKLKWSTGSLQNAISTLHQIFFRPDQYLIEAIQEQLQDLIDIANYIKDTRQQLKVLISLIRNKSTLHVCSTPQGWRPDSILNITIYPASSPDKFLNLNPQLKGIPCVIAGFDTNPI